MKCFRLSHPTRIINGTINLPSSKSISNRALILKYVLGADIELQNLSTADDTIIMQQALQQGNGIINVKNAGTCMRFLTAYFAAKQDCDVTLLCDERMEKRPVKELVNALKQLGADVTYLKEEGFPPLHLKGKKLKGGTLSISGDKSSQYISALLMIGAMCESMLTINITDEPTSFPYIEMTLNMIQQFGIEVQIRDESSLENLVIDVRKRIVPLNEEPEDSDEWEFPLVSSLRPFVVEPDWSAASYWFSIVALAKEAEIILPNLSKKTLQGDTKISHYMHRFGVGFFEHDQNITIKKDVGLIKHYHQFKADIKETFNKDIIETNLTDEPDLAPTLAVLAAATNETVVFSGLQNLIIKESNRLKAIETELNKLGFDVVATEDKLIVKSSWIKENNQQIEQELKPQPSNINSQTLNIQTYCDHRMAMAFAPLALVFDEIVIENPDVVEKSYPHFWEDLKHVGFVVSEI
jgi:3-phosphoshikimate 1-carboxyvinyltransferase